MSSTTRVANICLVNDTDNILLLERSKNLNMSKFWGFPGGIIENGENSQETALRELREETGILQNDINVFESQKFRITKPTNNLEITVYLAKLLRDVKITLNPFEHTDYKWINTNDLAIHKNVLPGIPTILRELLKLENLIDHTISKPTKIELIP